MSFAIPVELDEMLPLNGVERAALSAVCDALFPELPADEGAVPRVSEAGARALAVPERIEETMSALGTGERERLRLLLRLLERPTTMLLLSGRARRFSALAPGERARVLHRMSVSAIPQLRTGFQAFFRLAAFHRYSTMPRGVDNPSWSAIGYVASANPPAMRSRIAVGRADSAGRVDCDVCVIGSGAGGSVVAAELASCGKKVVVLEAGSDWQSSEFDQHEAVGTRELYLDRGTTTTGDLSVAFLAGASLGGGTTINWQSCFRTPDAILEEWTERSGCTHFSGESFSRSLDHVWGRLAVSRVESEVNVNNAILQRGCEALGYSFSRISRNSLGCDTSQCGYCVYGCRHGGKQSAAVTFLRDAQETGNVSVIARCRADRVVIEGGRVSGVTATASDRVTGKRRPVRIAASAVVAACGALNTPALLMRSGVAHPEIGRNLSIHPTTALTGVFADRVEAWRGPPQTVVCDEFAALRGTFGYRIEAAPAHPGLLAMATPWIDPRDHRQSMQRSAHRGVLIVLVRDRSTGRVRLGRDGRPQVHYAPGKLEHALLRHGMATSARILHAAGADEIQSLHARPLVFGGDNARRAESPGSIDNFCDRLAAAPSGKNLLQLFSAHQMGTCRMGRDRRRAVCDENGEVFGVRGLYIGDASAFPASSGVNPMITIMAMAHHTAGRIADLRRY
jgi:choline dehydrogenase-like flavoprotein